jgi:hypothetical protein
MAFGSSQEYRFLARVPPWLAIGDSTTSCKVKMLYASSLQLSIPANTIHTASHVKGTWKRTTGFSEVFALISSA